MSKYFAALLEKISDYLSTRKGLLPILGFVLVVLNLLLTVVFPDSATARYNIFLHLGILISIAGSLIGKIL